MVHNTLMACYFVEAVAIGDRLSVIQMMRKNFIAAAKVCLTSPYRAATAGHCESQSPFGGQVIASRRFALCLTHRRKLVIVLAFKAPCFDLFPSQIGYFNEEGIENIGVHQEGKY